MPLHHFHDDDEGRQRRLGYGCQKSSHAERDQCRRLHLHLPDQHGDIIAGGRAASDGAKIPAGTPDQAVSQVAMRMRPAGMLILHKAPAPFAGVLPAALASIDAASLARMEVDLAALIALLATDEASAGIPLADL